MHSVLHVLGQCADQRDFEAPGCKPWQQVLNVGTLFCGSPPGQLPPSTRCWPAACTRARDWGNLNDEWWTHTMWIIKYQSLFKRNVKHKPKDTEVSLPSSSHCFLLISLLTHFIPRADPGFEVRVGANGLENLGRCKWIGKLKKNKTTGGIVNIFQIYDYHSIYIYFDYDILQIRFFITILYILSPLIQYCIKNFIWENFRAPGAPPLNPHLHSGPVTITPRLHPQAGTDHCDRYAHLVQTCCEAESSNKETDPKPFTPRTQPGDVICEQNRTCFKGKIWMGNAISKKN